MGKKEGNILFRRLVHSYLSSVISISLVLFLVGISGIVVVNAKGVADYFKENVTISAIMNVEVTNSEAETLAKEFSQKKYVKSIDVISREQGVKEMEKLLGEDFLSVFKTNPIPVSLDVHVLADYFSKDSLDMIQQELGEHNMVADVVYQESLVDLMNANLEKIAIFMGVFIILLMFISFVLINNTVRLNVYSKRFTIHTMRLVGATKGFICKPFAWQGFFQGLISALIAILGLLAVLYVVRNEFNQLFLLFDMKILAIVLLALLVIGVLLCVISTVIVVRKLISLTNDELYY